jgi:hypothetical protein
MTGTFVTCPNGHPGPWRYVEAIEVWRDAVEVQTPDGQERALVVSSQWNSGDCYDDGVPDTGYLECHHSDDGIRCVERVELPAGLRVVWD